MIIRLTQKLAKKVKAPELQTSPLCDDPLCDWSMQMFDFDRKQHVLICNTRTFYSAVFLAGGIAAPHKLAVAGLQAIGEQLDGDMLLDAYQHRSTPGPMAVTYAKSLNRVITGSMNELILRATVAMADGVSLFKASAEVNRMLLSALPDRAGGKYGTPYDVMTRLLEGP